MKDKEQVSNETHQISTVLNLKTSFELHFIMQRSKHVWPCRITFSACQSRRNPRKGLIMGNAPVSNNEQVPTPPEPVQPAENTKTMLSSSGNNETTLPVARSYFFRKKTRLSSDTQAIATSFRERYTLMLIGSGKGQRWFSCEDGRWLEHSREEMLANIRDFFMELVDKSGLEDARQLLTVRLIDEILRIVAIDVVQKSMPKMDSDVIPCNNGTVVKWDPKSKSLVETEMQPDFHITHTLTVAYDPTAKHVLFDEKIKEIIPDENDRRAIQEYLGAALFSENRTRMILLLQGEGSTGKSVLVKIISGILGRERAFDLDFSLLGENFSLSGLSPHATLLSASETASRDLCGKGGAWAKKLVGGDEFQASLKYRNERVNHVGYFTVIMTSNESIRLDFTSNGQEWRDRLLPILFKHSIPVEKQDRNLVERLLRDEGPGILNWLLEGAQRVRSNDWIIHLTPEQQAIRDRLIEAGSNSIELFIRLFVKKDTTEDFTSSDAYKLYCRAVHNNGLEYYPESLFYKRFAQVIAEKYSIVPTNTVLDAKGKQVRGYRGLKLERQPL